MITVYLKTETRELTIHKNIGDIRLSHFWNVNHGFT
jgi:hypothetical protein